MKQNTSISSSTASAAQQAKPSPISQGLSALRKPAILRATGWSNSTLYNRIAAGDFPVPLRTGPRTVAWLESDIRTYFDRLEAERAVRSNNRAA